MNWQVVHEMAQGVMSWALTHPEETFALVTFVGGTVTATAAWITRLRVASHAERLEMLRAAARTAGGRILLEVRKRAPGESVEQFMLRRIREEALSQHAEFALTGKKVSATADKLEDMIKGELGNNPVALEMGVTLPERMPVFLMGEK